MDWTGINKFSARVLSGRWFRPIPTYSVGVENAIHIASTADRAWWDERHLNNPPGVEPPAALDLTDLTLLGWRPQDH